MTFLCCINWRKFENSSNIHLLFSIIFLLFLILAYADIVILLNIDTPNIPSEFFRLLITITFAVIFIKYTFSQQEELKFYLVLQNLVDEMQKNVEKVLYDEYAEQIRKLSEKSIKHHWIGLDKEPSFTNWVNFNDGNFYLKFLPMSKFYFFFNQGSINNEKYIEGGNAAGIMRFYINCDWFNRSIQGLENGIHKNGDFSTQREYYIQEYFNIRRKFICRNDFSSGMLDEYLGVIDNLKCLIDRRKINWPSDEFLKRVQNEKES